jgi:hypothetical protein
MQRPLYSGVAFLHAELGHNGAPRIAAWSRQEFWAATRQEAKSAERHTLSRCQKARFRLCQGEAEGHQPVANAALQFPESPLVIPEKQEIVRVTHVSSVTLEFRDPVVQIVKEVVGPQLACQISDRKSARSRGSFDEIVRREKVAPGLRDLTDNCTRSSRSSPRPPRR